MLSKMRCNFPTKKKYSFATNPNFKIVLVGEMFVLEENVFAVFCKIARIFSKYEKSDDVLLK